MEIIQSKQNARVKQWKKLHTAKGRKQAGAYLVEGTHLVAEALNAKQIIQALIVTPDYTLAQLPSLAGIMLYYVSAEVMRELSGTRQPQGVIAQMQLPTTPVNWEPTGRRYLLIDAVQDPGNLGTLIRTADAAGYDGVVLGDGTVDLYNDKVLRSTQGSLWHLEIVALPMAFAMERLRAAGVVIYATALHQDAQAYQTMLAAERLALLVGNEGSGVRLDLVEAADDSIYIPMPGLAESLNVAIAAGILMFHFI